jgi:hypothetical protein
MARGFSYSLKVLHRGLRTNILQFFIKKIDFFFNCKIFNFLVINPDSSKSRDLNLNNMDLQHWIKVPNIYHSGCVSTAHMVKNPLGTGHVFVLTYFKIEN